MILLILDYQLRINFIDKILKLELQTYIFVFLNGNREAREVTLPAGNYETIVCDGVINEQGLGEEHGGKVMVDGQSALILREKD